MKSKTPLQIFAEMVASSSVENAEMLRRILRQAQMTTREREIAEYLIAAADGSLPGERKGANSLKHILWKLRDIAGEVYEPAAREVLRYLVENRQVDLANVLPHLRDMRIAGVFYEQIKTGNDWRELVGYLEEHRCGDWRVAVNKSPRNLVSIAMRAGFDVFVGFSEIGIAVKARRGLRVSAGLLPGGRWVQVYPDLVLWQDETRPDLDDILASLDKAVSA